MGLDCVTFRAQLSQLYTVILDVISVQLDSNHRIRNIVPEDASVPSALRALRAGRAVHDTNG